MKQKEFESEVKEKMTDFGLAPSAMVWPAVERRIQPKKKRRVLAWWFFAGFLILGGGTTVYYSINNRNRSAIATNDMYRKVPENKTGATSNIKESTISNATKPEINSEPTSSIDTKIESKPDNIRIAQKQNKSTAKVSRMVSANSNSRIPIYVEKKQSNHHLLHQNKISDKTEKEKAVRETKKNITASAVLVTKATPDIEIANSHSMAIDTPLKSVPKTEVQKTDTVITKQVLASTTIVDSINQSVPVKNKLNSAWQRSVLFSLGSSSLSNGFTLFNKALLMDAAGGNLNNGGTAAAPVFINKRGLSFDVGGYLQKDITRKLTVRVGVGYTYLSWQQYIGQRIDSAFNTANASTGQITTSYYRPATNTNQTKYTNRYHLLGIGGDFVWKFMQRKRFSLGFDNGLAYRYLVGSSMLHYSDNLQGYYKDNQLLARHQIFYNSSLSIQLNKKWVIAPYIQYSLTKVLKANDQKHFSSFGIRGQLLFKK
jgi:hypothetical protein